jgi:hypothetical protein
MNFILKNGSDWPLPDGKMEQYQTTYPDVKVEQELRKAAQWLIDNPGRRKTAKGMCRYLNSWLGRAKPTKKRFVLGEDPLKGVYG